jgi:hypothetical protein
VPALNKPYLRAVTSQVPCSLCPAPTRQSSSSRSMTIRSGSGT